MRRFARALALVAALSPSARADDPSGTPLTLRHEQGAPLETKSTGGGLVWKLLALGALVGGGAYWAVTKKRGKRPFAPSEIRVVARASIGVRQELLVVEALGQKMLLGVTSGSIQRLADFEEPLAKQREEEEEEERPFTLGDRMSALVSGVGSEGTRAPASGRERPSTPTPVEGQARGLLTLKAVGSKR